MMTLEFCDQKLYKITANELSISYRYCFTLRTCEWLKLTFILKLYFRGNATCFSKLNIEHLANM